MGAALSPINSSRRLCVVAASPLTVRAFLLPHIRMLSGNFQVSVVANGVKAECGALLESLGVEPIDMRIERRPTPVADLRALRSLGALFKARGLDAVLTVTPKAGLLGMLAAHRANVRTRIHWFTGQVWANRRGLARRFLRGMDRMTFSCATHALADSISQRDFLEGEHVAPHGKIQVLAGGSISGVEPDRFKPDSAARSEIRGRLGIPSDALVFVFLGRVTRDKGIRELRSAFAKSANLLPRAHLIVVGPIEDHESAKLFGGESPEANRLHVVGPTQAPEQFLAASDVLVLPSYREGFGTTVLEAAACGLPAIVSNIYGLSDSVVDRSTGLLVPVGDASALAEAMCALARNRSCLGRMAESAQRRAIEEFHTSRLTTAFAQYLEEATTSRDRADCC